MNILHIEWKTRIKSLVVWAVVVIVILGVFMAFFPSMQSSGMQDLVNTKMNALPQDMMKILHMDSMADLTNIDAILRMFFSIFLLQLVCMQH